MHVGALNIYPVKGCHRVPCESAVVEPWGLAGDRRWVVVEAAARNFLTQREAIDLARIRPGYRDGGLLLRYPLLDELFVPDPVGGERVTVRLWRTEMPATLANAAAHEWVSKVLDREAELVWLEDPTVRPVEPGYALPTDRVNFADGYPLLLTTEASLDALNAAMPEPVPMTRFRPNLVVAGALPWAEDGWLGGRLRVGEVAFRAPKPCARCVVTTIDQETAERGREPLRTLGRLRRTEAGLLFGINLIPDGPGTISVGDEVSVLPGQPG